MVATLVLVATSATAEEYAVIVSPDVAVEDVTTDELNQIFRMEKLFWTAGKRIKVLLSEGDLENDSFLLTRIYRTDYSGLRRLILDRVYRGEIDLPPKVVADGSTPVYVARGSGVIAVVPASDTNNASVKVLSIDGKLPGADGYSLRR
jgi:hypothetical protein